MRVYGNAAVVTARVTINGTNREGKPVHRLSRFTDVCAWAGRPVADRRRTLVPNSGDAKVKFVKCLPLAAFECVSPNPQWHTRSHSAYIVGA